MWCDTNVLIRLVTNDLPEQVLNAQAVIDSAVPGEIEITDAVLAETCTILEFNAGYRLPRDLIHRALSRLLSQSAFSISPVAKDALKTYQKHPKLDIVDCLLLVLAEHKQANLLSFDKELLKIAKV
jgi:predicted nucleic-acid-binding protein